MTHGHKECMFCGTNLGIVPGLAAGTVSHGMCDGNDCIDKYNEMYSDVSVLPYKKLPVKRYESPLMDQLRAAPDLLREITG